MLEIKPVKEQKRIFAVCRSLGLVYSHAYYLYEAVSGGKLLASALFYVDGDTVESVHYEGDPEDAYLLDGVLRAGFHYASSQNLSTGRISSDFKSSHYGLLKNLNFPAEEYFNIENFFSKYKNCR